MMPDYIQNETYVKIVNQEAIFKKIFLNPYYRQPLLSEKTIIWRDAADWKTAP